MWQNYFKVAKIKPGRVNTALLGIIDFCDPNIPLEKIKELFENDFPYLEITPEGMQALYGIDVPATSEVKATKPVRRKSKKPAKPQGA